MLFLDCIGLLDAFDMHDTLFGHNEIVQGPSTVDPVSFLEFFSISKSIEKEEELRVLVRLVSRPGERFHPFLNLAHFFVLLDGSACLQRVTHIHDRL